MEENTKKNLKKVISILLPIVLVLVLFFGILQNDIISISSQKKMDNDNKIINGEETNSNIIINATVIIDFGNETIISKQIKSINNTVFGFLKEIANREEFDVKTTYYGQYDSIFIDSISSHTNGQNNKYWIYYLNSEPGSLGADKQIVKNGDVIEWKFEKSPY